MRSTTFAHPAHRSSSTLATAVHSSNRYVPPALEVLDTYKEVVVHAAPDHLVSVKQQPTIATSPRPSISETREPKETKPIQDDLDISNATSTDEFYLRRLRASGKDKAASVLGIVTLKEPSAQAWKTYVEQQQNRPPPRKHFAGPPTHDQTRLPVSSVHTPARLVKQPRQSKWGRMPAIAKPSQAKASSTESVTSGGSAETSPATGTGPTPTFGDTRPSAAVRKYNNRSTSRLEKSINDDIDADAPVMELEGDLPATPCRTTTFLDPPTPSREPLLDPIAEDSDTPPLDSAAGSTTVSGDESPRTPSLDDTDSRFTFALPEAAHSGILELPTTANEQTSTGAVALVQDDPLIRKTPGPSAIGAHRSLPSRTLRQKLSFTEPTILEEPDDVSTDCDSAGRPENSTPSLRSQPEVVRNFSYIRKYHTRSESSSSRPHSRASTATDMISPCTPTFTSADLWPTPESPHEESTTTDPVPPTQQVEIAPADSHARTTSDPPDTNPASHDRSPSLASLISAHWDLTSKERLHLGARVTRSEVTPWEPVTDVEPSHPPTLHHKRPPPKRLPVRVSANKSATVATTESARPSRLSQALARW